MYEPLQAGSHDPDPQRAKLGLAATTQEALSSILLEDCGAHSMAMIKQIEGFSTTFPELCIPQKAIPRFTWEQLERQLMFLAGTPQRQSIVAERVAAMRRSAAYKPEEMILQEILIEAWVLLDEEPQGPLEDEGAPR